MSPKACALVEYDLAFLGHIVHSDSETDARPLFKRLQQALKPPGRLAVIDMIPNDQRAGPPFPLVFALNMLVHTDGGNTAHLANMGPG